MAVPTIGLVIFKAVRDEKGKVSDLYFEYANGSACAALGGTLPGTLLSELSGTGLAEKAGRLRQAVGGDRNDHFITGLGTAGMERWFRSTVVPMGEDGLLLTLEDITGIKEAEAELLSLKVEMIAHEHTQNQFFLLELSDALRPLSDPVEVQEVAMAMLAKRLHVKRAYYYLIGEDQESCIPWIGYESSSVRLPKVLRLSDYGADIAVAYRAGCTLIYHDVEKDPRTIPLLEAWRAIGCRSGVGVPLVKNGKLLAVAAAHHDSPRTWTNTEVKLIEDVAERTWASVLRTSSEMALRESMEKYRALVYGMNEGYVLVELIYDDHGKVVDYLHLEVNDAVERLTGLKVATGMRMSEVLCLEDYWYALYQRVAATGKPERLERFNDVLRMAFSVYATRVGGEGSRLIAVIFDDITDRSR